MRLRFAPLSLLLVAILIASFVFISSTPENSISSDVVGNSDILPTLAPTIEIVAVTAEIDEVAEDTNATDTPAENIPTIQSDTSIETVVDSSPEVQTESQTAAEVSSVNIVSQPQLITVPEEQSPAALREQLQTEAVAIPETYSLHVAANVNYNDMEVYVAAFNATILKHIPATGTYVISSPVTPPTSEIVQSSEPDYLLAAANDSVNNIITREEIDAAKAALPANTEPVLVAVIDSGVCLTHPALSGHFAAGYDFVENDNIAQDEFNHGCGVAGIIAEIAPHAVIIPYRVLDGNGLGSYSDLAAAIIQAVNDGAQVINLSLGARAQSTLLYDAIRYAHERGVKLIGAAGNTSSTLLYPAAYLEVVSVGSTDENNEISDFSARNADTYAPGENLSVAAIDDTYHTVSGTSFAAPKVSGLQLLEEFAIDVVEDDPVVTDEEITTEIYIDDKHQWSFEYESNVKINIGFENENSEADVIKRRTEITIPDGNLITIDVWEDSESSLLDWFDRNHRFYLSDSVDIDNMPLPNAKIASMDAIAITDNQLNTLEPIASSQVVIFRDAKQVYRIEHIGLVNIDTTDFYQLLETFTTIQQSVNNVAVYQLSPLLVSETQALVAKCGGYTDTTDNKFPCCSNGGNCTWWARYQRPDFGYDMWRHAKHWYQDAISKGYPVGQTPRVGAIAVWDGWQNVTNWGNNPAGHVGYVESVSNDKIYFTVSNMDCGGQYGSYTKANITKQSWLPSSILGFIYKKGENPNTPPNEVSADTIHDYNNDGVSDIWAIHRADGNNTAFHVIDGSNPDRFLMQDKTVLHRTNDLNWSFAVADYNSDGTPDIWAIMRNDGGKTAFHVIDGSNPDRFLMQDKTVLHRTNDLNWSFAVADYNSDGTPDIWAIHRADGNNTAFHVIDGSNPDRFLMQDKTVLHKTNDTAWSFVLGHYNQDNIPDIYAINHRDGSNTAVHIINGANPSEFLLRDKLVIHQTYDRNWEIGERYFMWHPTIPGKPTITAPQSDAHLTRSFNIQLQPGATNYTGTTNYRVLIRDIDGNVVFDNGTNWSTSTTIPVTLPYTAYGRLSMTVWQGDTVSLQSEPVTRIFYYYGYKRFFAGDYDGDGNDDRARKLPSELWSIDYAADGFDGWDIGITEHGKVTSIAAPADYDGDGIIDISVRSNNTRRWYIDYAADGFTSGFEGWNVSYQGYGSTIHHPVPGDYDGDGRIDLSIKSDAGVWRIDYAVNGFTGWDDVFNEYGGANAHPVPADYDGDEHTDLSVKLDSGEWFIDYASNGFGTWDKVVYKYGDHRARPVPADYDGDGKADLSVKVDDGRWLIDYAHDGFGAWDERYDGYGSHNAHPVPGDYDGDGLADLSIKIDSGEWRVDYACNGFGEWDENPCPVFVAGDFDGDGKADRARRSHNRQWIFDYAIDGFNGWEETGYYDNGSIFAHPVPADYDGDGITDISIKENDGTWLIDYSENGFNGWDWQETRFGGHQAHPVPADYDGDGKADLSIKIDKDGNWLIDYSSNGFNGWDWQEKRFGGHQAHAVPADYDGDGTADLAIKNDSGLWLIDYTIDGYNGWDWRENRFGGYKTHAVPADYDGDDTADLSLKNDFGSWIIDYTINGYTEWDERHQNHGGRTNIPLPADYDGDGKADISVKGYGKAWLVDYACNGFGGWDTEPCDEDIVPAIYNITNLQELIAALQFAYNNPDIPVIIQLPSGEIINLTELLVGLTVNAQIADDQCFLPHITGNVTMKGNGATLLVDDTLAQSLFCVESTGTLDIENLTIEGANSPINATVLVNDGTTIFTDVTIKNSSSVPAIYNTGSFEMTKGSFADTDGVLKNTGTGAINGVCISENSGTAIENLSPVAFDATGNWWDTDASTLISAGVNYQPVLQDAPCAPTVNIAPVITAPDIACIVTDSDVSLTIQVTDPDDDLLRYTFENLPDGIIHSDMTQGTLTGTLNTAAGTYTSTLTVRDSSNAPVSLNFDWCVEDAPEITPEVTIEPEVTPDTTPVPEVTPDLTPEPEVTPEMTIEPEVTPEITPESMPAPDADWDGYPDTNDTCPTEGDWGLGLDEVGCPYKDTDGDNVFDRDDVCLARGNENGLGVDADGCPYMDVDWDGVFDRDDSCPIQGDEYGNGIDSTGCPISNTPVPEITSEPDSTPAPTPARDSDSDGIVDTNDACPTEGDWGLGLDNSGCPYKDTDGDDVFDRNDSCPTRGNEAGLGIDDDGCPYMDADWDGVFDRNDTCPTQGNEYGNGIDSIGCPIPSD